MLALGPHTIFILRCLSIAHPDHPCALSATCRRSSAVPARCTCQEAAAPCAAGARAAAATAAAAPAAAEASNLRAVAAASANPSSLVPPTARKSGRSRGDSCDAAAWAATAAPAQRVLPPAEHSPQYPDNNMITTRCAANGALWTQSIQEIRHVHCINTCLYLSGPDVRVHLCWMLKCTNTQCMFPPV